jgi:hypothetical protein
MYEHKYNVFMVFSNLPLSKIYNLLTADGDHQTCIHLRLVYTKGKDGHERQTNRTVMVSGKPYSYFEKADDGTSERGLAIMEIQNGSARVVNPAPRSFANPSLSN